MGGVLGWKEFRWWLFAEMEVGEKPIQGLEFVIMAIVMRYQRETATAR